MKRRLKITAQSKLALRQVVADADVDLGCRPVVRPEGEGISAFGVAEETEIARLSTRVVDGVSIEVLEAVPPPEARMALVPGGNRFLAGAAPRGLGIKE